MICRNFVFLRYFTRMLYSLGLCIYCFVIQFSVKFVGCMSVKYLVFIIEYYCFLKTLVFVIMLVY